MTFPFISGCKNLYEIQAVVGPVTQTENNPAIVSFVTGQTKYGLLMAKQAHVKKHLIVILEKYFIF